MTKLRPDGYLETDDAVVAACFLGHIVDGQDCHGQLDTIEFDEPFLIAWGMGQSARSETLLIPAATVAEVWEGFFIRVVLSHAIDQTKTPIGAWLITHTGEGE